MDRLEKTSAKYQFLTRFPCLVRWGDIDNMQQLSDNSMLQKDLQTAR